MKKITIIFILLMGYWGNVIAQTTPPGWQWATMAQNQSSSYLFDARSVANDKDNNFYACGFAKTQANFGSLYLDATSGAIFVVKYDSKGNVLWLKKYDADRAYPSHIVIGASGNIYMTGIFNSPINFGNQTLVNSGGDQDAFTAKFDPSGNVIWAKSGGGNNNDGGFLHNISLDDQENIVIGGLLGYSGKFDDTNNITGNSFLVKYDSSGNTVWAKGLFRQYYSEILDVHTGKDGSVYITGAYNKDSLYFDDTHYIVHELGGQNAFVAKLDPQGNFVWAKTIGSLLVAAGEVVTIDEDKNVFVLGEADTTISFGGVQVPLKNKGKEFLVKYDSTGNMQWVNWIGGKGLGIGSRLYDYTPHGLCIDKNGNVDISGSFRKMLLIGEQYPVISKTETISLFVAQYSNEGKFNWVNYGCSNLGDISSDAGGMCLDNDNNILLAGGFQGDTAFFGYQRAIGSWSNNIYIVKLADVTGVSKVSKQGMTPYVYPNPVTNQLYVSNITKGTIIQLFNISGQLLITTQSTDATAIINTASLFPGSYFLKLTDSKGNNQTVKVVKE